MAVQRLVRIQSRGRVAGVCAGLADYLGIDEVLVRAAWVVLTIVPGAIVGGVLAYIAAWILMPEAAEPVAAPQGRRITRSNTDRKVAGVCAGLAEYFDADPTVIRLLWVVLSIFCGAVIGGVIAYLVAWLIIPPAREHTFHTPAPAAPAV